MKSGDILGGKYRLEQRIGAGAMGEVWSAENQATGGKVALKLILPESAELRAADLRQRLMREAKACGKLRHRNIVQIYDVSETPQGEPFLVMELLSGQTLAELLEEKRRIEPARAARIAGEIASALSVAHAAKVIHRDLKPANIFLHREEGMPEESFVVKVLDFGISKSLDSADGLATKTGAVVGSPAYMSPEQVGMRKDLDHATDIWSLGIVLYEMLTGARPFTGNVEEVVRQIVMVGVKPIPPPSDRVRGIPPELDAIVARSTEAKRAERYADAAELSRALMMVAESSRSMRIPVGVAAGPVSSSERRPSFPGMEATSPLLEQQRIPTWTGGDAAKTPAPRAAMGSMPDVVDEEGLAATVPMQRSVLAQMRPSAGAPASGAVSPASARGATGTQLLIPNQPVASPMPAWRKEMQQALAAHRQSSAELQAVSVEQPEQGGTQMLTPELMELAPAVDPSVTTSAAGAMVQPVGATAGAVGAEQVGAQGPRRKGGAGLLWGAVGVGFLAAFGVGGVVLMKLSGSSGEEATSGKGAAVEAARSAGPAAVVVASAVAGPVPPPAVTASAGPEVAGTAEEKAPEAPATADAGAAADATPTQKVSASVPPNKQPWPKKQAPAPAATGQSTKCTPTGFLKKCSGGKHNPTAP